MKEQVKKLSKRTLIEKKDRPKITNGTTTKVQCGCGHLYITINRANGDIFEIFAVLGKAGGCACAQNEALTRCITLGLRYGIPIEEYIDQLDNIKCPSPIYDGKEPIYSCAHAIATVLKREMNNGRNL